MTKRGRPRHPDILTPREWEVLDLLRGGLSNEEIGGRLGITERTAKYHVSEILSKLHLSSRSEAAAWQPELARPWWLGAGAPVAFLWRKASVGWLSTAVAGGLVAVTLGGLGLIAFLLVRDGDGEAVPVIDGTVVEERIAFSIEGNIYSVRPDGSGLREVRARNSEAYSAPEYSPDAEKLAYVVDRHRVIVASAAGGAVLVDIDLFVDRTPPTPIASNWSMGPVAVHWSPDGTMLLVTRQRLGGSGASDVLLVNEDGSDLRIVLESGLFIEGTWWQPLEGEPLVMVVAGDASMRAITYDLDGTEAGTGLPAAATRPAVASIQHPDGASVLVRSTLGSPEPFGPIEVEDSAGASIVAGGCGATWSPDGERIAFYNGEGIAIKDADAPVDDVDLILSNEDLAVGRRITIGEEPCIGLGISWTAGARVVPQPTPVVQGGIATYHDGPLGVTFEYPAGWVTDAAPMPYASCNQCVVVGPAQAAQPYGVAVFTEDIDIADCAGNLLQDCPGFLGNRALPRGDARTLQVGGTTASQREIERQPPLGLTNETGETMPYREIWTGLAVGNRPLFFIAFYREDDTAAEREVTAAYAALLASVRLE